MNTDYSHEYYKTHFREKMEKILENKYPEIKRHNRVTHFTIKYQEYLDERQEDIAESTIKAYMSPTRSYSPPLEQLINLCNFFGVDIDYFLTEQETFNQSIKSSSETLGMSESTIEKIRDLSECQKYVLEALINNNLGDDHNSLLSSLLDDIYYYQASKESSTSTLKMAIPSVGVNNTITNKRKIGNFLKFEALNKFEKCLDVKIDKLPELMKLFDFLHKAKSYYKNNKKAVDEQFTENSD